MTSPRTNSKLSKNKLLKKKKQKRCICKKAVKIVIKPTVPIEDH